MEKSNGAIPGWADQAKRAIIFIGSLAISFWILIRFIALGMFGSQLSFTWWDYWQESMLLVLSGGLVAGLLWGRSSLEKIFWLAVPCGVWFGFMLAMLPFVIFDSDKPMEAGEWLEYLSSLLLFFSAASIPVLAATLAHAYWRRYSWPETRGLLAQPWRTFRKSIRNQPGFFESIRFALSKPGLIYRIIATLVLFAVLWLYQSWSTM